MWWLQAALPSAWATLLYSTVAIDSQCHLGIDWSGRHYVCEIIALQSTVTLKWKTSGWEPMRWAKPSAYCIWCKSSCVSANDMGRNAVQNCKDYHSMAHSWASRAHHGQDIVLQILCIHPCQKDLKRHTGIKSHWLFQTSFFDMAQHSLWQPSPPRISLVDHSNWPQFSCVLRWGGGVFPEA